MKGWKTLAFAIIMGAIAALSDVGVQQYVAANLPWLGPMLATAVVVLRALTTSPIFKKE